MGKTDFSSLFRFLVKRSAAVFGVYFLGYFNFSYVWLFGGLALAVVREKYSRERELKRNLTRATALMGEQEVLAKLHDLPSWVHFPDIERAEWLNKMLSQLWPYVGGYVKDLLRVSIEPSIAESLKAYKLRNFKFEKIVVGDIPPRIGGVKVYNENIHRSEIVMDLEVFYAGDCEYEVSISRITAGLKDFQMHGVIRVVFKPLIKEIPLFGGLQVFFLNNPDIDFNLIGLADVLDMPGLSGILRKIISDTIASMMVLPNKFPIVLSNSVSKREITSSEPKGVLRVQVVEARDLMAKDRGMIGMGKSDPYAIVCIGATEFRTEHIDNTVNPVWDYCCEFLVATGMGQQLFAEVYDRDDATQDDRLGRASMDVKGIAQEGFQDVWIPLEDARSGQLHLRLQWLFLTTEQSSLKAQLSEMEALQQLKTPGLHSAVLTVYVDSAKSLPFASRAAPEPDPQVGITVGGEKKLTAVRYKTADPVWEEGFSFLVQNPSTQEMLVEVIDAKSSKVIGNLSYSIYDLFDLDGMKVEDFPFQLKDASQNSQITMSLSLKILTSQPTYDEEDDDVKSPAGSKETSDELPKGAPKSPLKSTPALGTRPSPPSVDEMVSSTFTPIMDAANINSDEVVDRNIRRRAAASASAGLGKVQVTLRYASPRSTLVVVLHKILELSAEGDSDLPDPYVKVYLMPDKIKRKTDVVKDNCNPVFDETLEFSVKQEDVANSQLEFIIVSKKGIFSKNPIIGMFRIDLSQLNLTSAVTEWYDILPDENDSE